MVIFPVGKSVGCHLDYAALAQQSVNLTPIQEEDKTKALSVVTQVFP